jgi:predicted amidohydrolase
MTRSSTDKRDGLTRRQAIRHAGRGLVGLAVMAPLSGRGATTAAGAPAAKQMVPAKGQNTDAPPSEKLRVATCQFPVSGQIVDNVKYIRDFLHQAAAAGAHLLHTSEASLSGYPGVDLPSFQDFGWDTLRRETTVLRQEARDLGLWLVLGSAHFLDERTKPTNCLYLIDPQGHIVDRYDKCMCTGGDQKHYSAGNRLVTHDIRGVRIGLAICYDICWPQIYMAYRELGVTLMVHSFHNARGKGPNCLDVLNVRQVPTRCADNRLWAVANNSSQPYSHWGSFIARPDASIAQQLGINQPGMLIHDFPDGLSEGGWFHNQQPLRLRDDEIMTWGTPSSHPRQANGQAEP